MMDETRRSTAARVGLVALSLLLPGVAWFRLGNWRAGLGWFALLIGEWLGLVAIYAVVTISSPLRYAVVIAVMLGVALATLAIAMISTWRASALKGETRSWWTRWYALTGLIIAASLTAQGATNLAHHFYKPFYAAAESMTPTLAPKDKFLADMGSNPAVKRGAVLLFETNGQIRIYRVVGLPGDRIAMRGGTPVINGRPAYQRFDGDFAYADFDGPMTARRFEERLPGETGSHVVLDLGSYPDIDDAAELLIPPGLLFVLGDNRDRAADSRVSPLRNGVGLLSFDDIRGRPLFIYWSHDRSRIGIRFTP